MCIRDRFCPSFTFAATAEVIPWVGATGVFVDVLQDTYNMDPDHLVASIEKVIADGKLTPKVVIAVDLFGQPADYPKIRAICDKYGMKLISDSAQGFGCTLNGKHPIEWADCQTASFFPAKPLGCYGAVSYTHLDVYKRQNHRCAIYVLLFQ